MEPILFSHVHQIWTKEANWTEWQSVSQKSNCFDLTVSSIEINNDPVGSFHYAVNKGDVRTTEQLLEEGVPVYYVDEVDWTALFYAAQLNRTDVIRLLLQKGANINTQNCWSDIHPYITLQGGI